MANVVFDLIVRGATVVTEQVIARCDLGVRAGRIAAIEPHLDGEAGDTVDAGGLVALPGLVDPHVHLGLPTAGTRTSDSPASGTAAALFGGVTTVIDFTLQAKGQTLADALRARRAEFDGLTHCDYTLHANVTDMPNLFPAETDGAANRDGAGPAREAAPPLAAQLDALLRAGVTSLKAFTCYSENEQAIPMRALRVLFREARRRGMQVLVHAEADRLVTAATRRLEREGRTGPADYPASRPVRAEVEAIGEVIGLAQAEGAAPYFVHVSSEAGARAVGRGRGGGAVYFETCPQYLFLDAAAYKRPDGAQYLLAPPLRGPDDVAFLRACVRANAATGVGTGGAVADAVAGGACADPDAVHLPATGRVAADVVATDHCAFRTEQKAGAGAPFTRLPKGLPGIETRLALTMELLRQAGGCDYGRLASLLARRPAEIFGLYPRKGAIRIGADADLVLLDPEEAYTLTASDLHMATDCCPYEGRRVRGRVREVFLRGRRVISGGRLAAPPHGQFLPRGRDRGESRAPAGPI